MADVDIPGFGTLWIGDKPDLPLLIVFGGVDVTQSILDGTKATKGEAPISADVYMWKYLEGLKNRYHIFVSLRPKHLNGKAAYKSLTDKAQDGTSGFTPKQQILYLFSGGWLPGMMILREKDAVKNFSSIFLVDIWMGVGSDGNTISPDFYTHFVNANADKVTYVHTTFGANNDTAMKFIVKKVGPDRAVEVTGPDSERLMHIHMRTNEAAVKLLP